VICIARRKSANTEGAKSRVRADRYTGRLLQYFRIPPYWLAVFGVVAQVNAREITTRIIDERIHVIGLRVLQVRHGRQAQLRHVGWRIPAGCPAVKLNIIGPVSMGRFSSSRAHTPTVTMNDRDRAAPIACAVTGQSSQAILGHPTLPWPTPCAFTASIWLPQWRLKPVCHFFACESRRCEYTFFGFWPARRGRKV